MSVRNQTSSFALASLTETYTDSEGEEEGAEEDIEENDKIRGTPGSSGNSNSSAVTPPVVIKSNIIRPAPIRPARLVSYHDDTLISDEEGAQGDGSYEVDGDEVNEMEVVTDDRNGITNENQPANTKDPLVEEEEDGIIIPPEPPGKCSNELQEKIARLHDRMLAGGLDMNKVIQQRKDFRNPSIYEKLIQFCGINEMGTNYDASVYDPQRWGKESYFEELAKVQKAEMDRRERERREKAKVEYVSGTARKGGNIGGASVEVEDGKNKRKSKWDQVGAGVGGNVGAVHLLKPAGLIQAPAVGTSVTSVPASSSTQALSSLTTSITGTKGTVISAFGSLPKKPRV